MSRPREATEASLGRAGASLESAIARAARLREMHEETDVMTVRASGARGRALAAGWDDEGGRLDRAMISAREMQSQGRESAARFDAEAAAIATADAMLAAEDDRRDEAIEACVQDVARLEKALAREREKTAEAYRDAEGAMERMDAEFGRIHSDAMEEKQAEIDALEEENDGLRENVAARHAHAEKVQVASNNVADLARRCIATRDALQAENAELRATLAGRAALSRKQNAAIKTAAGKNADLRQRLGACDDDLAASNLRAARAGSWRGHMRTLAAGAAMGATAAAAAAFDPDTASRSGF